MRNYELGDSISYGKLNWYIVNIMEPRNELILLSQDIICKRNHDGILEWLNNEGIHRIVKNKDTSDLIERSYFARSYKVFIPCTCLAYDLIPEIKKVPSKETWWSDWKTSAKYSMTQQEYDILRDQNHWGYGEGPTGIAYYTSGAVDANGEYMIENTKTELGVRPLIIISTNTAKKCTIKRNNYSQALLTLAKENSDPKNPDLLTQIAMSHGQKEYNILRKNSEK